MRAEGYSAVESITAALGTIKLSAFAEFALAAAAIAGVIALVDHFTLSFGEAQKTAEEASQKYEDQRSKVVSLNTELETANTRIAELQAKGSLTFVEDDELQRLQDSTEELSKQLDFEQRLLEMRGAENADAARNALQGGEMVYHADTGELKDLTLSEGLKIGGSLMSGALSPYFTGLDNYATSAVKSNLVGGIDAAITKLEELKAKRDELSDERLELDPVVDIKEIDRYEANIADLDSQITTITNQ